MSHTPGPWKHSVTHPLSGDAWFVVTDRNGSGPIMDIGGKEMSGQVAEAKYLITDPKEIEANARLIAAAPDMLKALERAEQTIRNLGHGFLTGDGQTIAFNESENLRTAIARAKGEDVPNKQNG